MPIKRIFTNFNGKNHKMCEFLRIFKTAGYEISIYDVTWNAGWKILNIFEVYKPSNILDEFLSLTHH